MTTSPLPPFLKAVSDAMFDKNTELVLRLFSAATAEERDLITSQACWHTDMLSPVLNAGGNPDIGLSFLRQHWKDVGQDMMTSNPFSVFSSHRRKKILTRLLETQRCTREELIKTVLELLQTNSDSIFRLDGMTAGDDELMLVLSHLETRWPDDHAWKQQMRKRMLEKGRFSLFEHLYRSRPSPLDEEELFTLISKSPFYAHKLATFDWDFSRYITPLFVHAIKTSLQNSYTIENVEGEKEKVCRELVHLANAKSLNVKWSDVAKALVARYFCKQSEEIIQFFIRELGIRHKLFRDVVLAAVCNQEKQLLKFLIKCGVDVLFGSCVALQKAMELKAWTLCPLLVPPFPSPLPTNLSFENAVKETCREFANTLSEVHANENHYRNKFEFLLQQKRAFFNMMNGFLTIKQLDDDSQLLLRVLNHCFSANPAFFDHFGVFSKLVEEHPTYLFFLLASSNKEFVLDCFSRDLPWAGFTKPDWVEIAKITIVLYGKDVLSVLVQRAGMDFSSLWPDVGPLALHTWTRKDDFLEAAYVFHDLNVDVNLLATPAMLDGMLQEKALRLIKVLLLCGLDLSKSPKTQKGDDATSMPVTEYPSFSTCSTYERPYSPLLPWRVFARAKHRFSTKQLEILFELEPSNKNAELVDWILSAYSGGRNRATYSCFHDGEIGSFPSIQQELLIRAISKQNTWLARLFVQWGIDLDFGWDQQACLSFSETKKARDVLERWKQTWMWEDRISRCKI